ncbi:MAG: MOSC domain-containing protein [Gammaproteobacteria bacterium]|nr:MAG: MOSC domain-containing protein [Gammaproteobacteria bacterium]
MSKIIKSLHRYPIKSFRGESLKSLRVKFTGFEFDRHWMLVDDKGVFMSQRRNSRMALIEARLQGEFLLIKIPNQEIIKSAIEISENSKLSDYVIWQDEIKALAVNPKIDQLISEFLNKPCQLVVMSARQPRTITDSAAKGIVSFADAFPFLLIGTESLATLNNKLVKNVTMENFRPNIVIETTKAHEEDSWQEIQIGEVRFRNVKLCSRCILTTVDPKTAERSQDQEPLSTLITYRKIEQKIMFGSNLIALNEGLIKAEDNLKVLSIKTS